jgi:hypothetical protein
VTYRDFDLWLVEQARSLPCPMNKESDAEKAAQQQQQQFSEDLHANYKTQFAENQAILSVLSPQLIEMARNPAGFGATEYAALQAKIVNDTGAQYSNEAKQAALSFATSNEAGLPSGVEAQVQGSIAAGAAGTVAAKSADLAVQNEMLKQQQKEFALTTLGGISSTLGSEAGSTAGTGVQSADASFKEAQAVYNQGSLWKNILGGVVGAGLNFATGGISGLVQGGSFLAGGGQALGGSPVTG